MTDEEMVKKYCDINKHNQLVILKAENKSKDEQIKKISTEGKKLIDEFSQKNQEKNYYKEIVDSMPNFIVKLFKKNKKAITE